MTDTDAEHGAYNGWCRVEGIPLKATDCIDCLRAEVERLLAERDALRVRLEAAQAERITDAEADRLYPDPPTEYGPKVLARAVLNDRTSRHLSQEDIMVRAKQLGKSISLGTLRNIENARMVRDLRSGPIQGLAAGMGWTVGRVIELLYGTTEEP